MTDCQFCPVEKDCAYEYKPCDCVHQRKFKRHSKPHNGTIDQWGKLPCGEKDGFLDYQIVGFTLNYDPPKSIRTSRVVKHEGNEIETHNSRYTLGEKHNG